MLLNAVFVFVCRRIFVIDCNYLHLYADDTQLYCPPYECLDLHMRISCCIDEVSMLVFFFTGPILIRRNIYTVIFEFNLIKSTVSVRLWLELRVGIMVRVFLVMYVM